TEQGNAHDGVAGQQAALTTASSAAFLVLPTVSSLRNFELNGHGDGCASIHKSNSESTTELRCVLLDSKSQAGHYNHLDAFQGTDGCVPKIDAEDAKATQRTLKAQNPSTMRALIAL